MKRPDFEKYADGLVPVIVQDADTAAVLMLGYMNEDALERTRLEGYVVFFSRSKQRLWMKGESSGNTLRVIEIQLDCDQDCLLVRVKPSGPVCHTGALNCFRTSDRSALSFLDELDLLIAQRIAAKSEASYVSQLYEKGLNKIAQKVGEEAVELIIEAKDPDEALFRNEAADLLFHYLILLRAKGCSLRDVVAVLRVRNKEYAGGPD